MKLPDFISNRQDFQFIISGTETLKFSEISANAFLIAASLGKLPQKSKIGLFTSHSKNFITGLLAIWYAGHTPVPLGNIASSTILKEAAARVSLVSILCDNATTTLTEKLESLNIESAGSGIQTIKANYNFTPERTAVILLTSGSTGEQKQIPLTFSNLTSSADMLGHTLPEIKNSVLGATLPFFHIGGFSQITRAIQFGTSLYIPDKTTSESIAEIIRYGYANSISIVPTTLRYLLENKITPHENIKHIFVGGSAANSEDIIGALDKDYPVYKVYGSTETSAMITLAGPHQLKKHPAASGQPLSGVKIIIKNDEEIGEKSGKDGIIVIASPTLSAAVINDSTEYITGDIGYLDEENNLFITGRSSRMIISGGYNVNPEEIEKIMLQHNDIKNVYVSAVPDKKWGEKIVALVVTSTGFDEIAVRNFLTEHLPLYKIPKVFISVENIPLSPLGKPDKTKIDALLLENSKE